LRKGMQFGNMVRALALAGVAVAGTVSAGCSGGTNRFDPNVPVFETRDIRGVWEVSALSNNERFVTCQDPDTIVGNPVTHLLDRGVILGSCSPTDAYEFIPNDPVRDNGTGRFVIRVMGVESKGSYVVEKSKLTLRREEIAGVPLKGTEGGEPIQKLVFSIVDTADGIELVPVQLPVAYVPKNNADPIDDDGNVVVANIAPKMNSDNTVSTIILPHGDAVPVIQTDLSVAIQNVFSASQNTDTPGFVRSFFVKPRLRKS